MEFVNCKCKHVAIENPKGIMSTIYRKPDQIIHPWQFGHGEVKGTCFWLKNLPKLRPTKIVSGRSTKLWNTPQTKNRAKIRSKTFLGVAKAMANQWGTCTHIKTTKQLGFFSQDELNKLIKKETK